MAFTFFYRYLQVLDRVVEHRLPDLAGRRMNCFRIDATDVESTFAQTMSASATRTYEAGFLAALDKICARDVRRVYGGHGPPVTEHCNQRLHESHRWPLAPGRQRGTRNQATA